MATFDASKFLNFYGFIPQVFDRVKGKLAPLPVRKPGPYPVVQVGGGAATMDIPLVSALSLTWEDATTSTIQTGNVEAKRKKQNTYTFEVPPVITVNLKKNVVTTKIAGSSRQPVVEIIGFDSFQVKIQGYIEGTPRQTSIASEQSDAATDEPSLLNVRDEQFPQDKLEELYQVFSKNEALTVDCILLNKMGIQRIVITGMPDITYYPTAFTFTFDAVADQHQEVLVLDDK